MKAKRNSLSKAAAPERRSKPLWREYAEALALAAVLTIVIRSFLIQAFRIPTGSMEDTLLVGDFLFVNKFVYGAQIPLTDIRLPGIGDPRPGDIIVFRFPQDPSKDYIKRCVAVGGQKVEVRDKRLLVDDVLRVEPYVKHVDPKILPRGRSERDNFGPIIVPEGHLFMMGDNRDNSHDSRFWGCMNEDLIKGKALFIYWSWDPRNKLLGFLNTPRFSRLGDLVR